MPSSSSSSCALPPPLMYLVTTTRSSCQIVRRHATRSPINAALVDRYSVIRNFFNQQRQLVQPEASNRLVLLPRRGISVGPSLGASSSPRLFTTEHFDRRYFHFTRLINLEPKSSGKHASHVSPEKPPFPQDTETSVQPPPPPTPPHPPGNLENYPPFFRRLALSLPHPHRPTREDFLNVANGFWQRTRIRFKWFTIKSFRKFNADDISAFVTWFLMSQTLWILVGT